MNWTLTPHLVGIRLSSRYEHFTSTWQNSRFQHHNKGQTRIKCQCLYSHRYHWSLSTIAWECWQNIDRHLTWPLKWHYHFLHLWTHRSALNGPCALGFFNGMRKYAEQDLCSASNLMSTVPPSITEPHLLSMRQSLMLKRPNQLVQPDDMFELDEMVEEAAFFLKKSGKLQEKLEDEFKLIYNYQASRPLLELVGANAYMLWYISADGHWFLQFCGGGATSHHCHGATTNCSLRSNIYMWRICRFNMKVSAILPGTTDSLHVNFAPEFLSECQLTCSVKILKCSKTKNMQ